MEQPAEADEEIPWASTPIHPVSIALLRLKSELPTDTLAILQSFYQERDQQNERFEILKVAAQEPETVTKWSMDDFAEDWNASQFWVIVKLQLDYSVILMIAFHSIVTKQPQH